MHCLSAFDQLAPLQLETCQRDLEPCDLQEHHTPVASGLVGGFLIGVIGVFLPPTMFWGEFEIRTLANPVKTALPHIWPKGGFYGTEAFMQVCAECFHQML